jgi:hypothetical protein
VATEADTSDKNVRGGLTIVATIVVLLMLIWSVFPSIIAYRYAARHSDFRVKPMTLSCWLRGRRDLYQFEVVNGQEK